jgi:hypothetical protein
MHLLERRPRELRWEYNKGGRIPAYQRTGRGWRPAGRIWRHRHYRRRAGVWSGERDAEKTRPRRAGSPRTSHVRENSHARQWGWELLGSPLPRSGASRSGGLVLCVAEKGRAIFEGLFWLGRILSRAFVFLSSRSPMEI